MARLAYLILLSSSLLLSCGGGGNDGSITTSPPVSLPNQPNVPTVGQHRIELGPISGARVRVLAPEGSAELFSGTTDAAGYFRLNTGVVRDAWERVKTRPEYVWVTASGGIDTDPNDDGILEPGEAIPLAGELRGIVPIGRLLNDSNVRVNLLSAVIADVLGNTTDLTEDRIVDTAKQLGFPDVDRDGRISVSDVLFYEMGSASGLETELRSYYLNTVHRGDSSRRTQFISAMLVDFLPVRYTLIQQGAAAAVQFHRLNPNHTVFVSYAVPNMESAQPVPTVGTSTYMLNVGQKIFFRECSAAMVCSPTQALLWTGTGENSFVAAPDGIVGNVYQDTTFVERLRAELNRKTIELQEAADAVIAAETAATTARRAVEATQAQIEAIDRELAALGPH